MIKDTFRFVKENKWFCLFALCVFAVYAYLGINSAHVMPREENSAAVKSFEKMETQFNEKIKNAEVLKSYIDTHPVETGSFGALTLFMVLALTGGIWLNGYWVFKPDFRKHLDVPEPASTTPWQISMVFRVVFLFMGASLVLGVVLALIKKFIVPDLTDNFFLILHTTMTDLLALGFIFWTIRAAKGNPADLGLRVPSGNWFREIKIGFSGYMSVLPLFFGVLLALLIIASKFSYEPPTHPLVNVFLEEEERSPWLMAYSAFLAIIMGPVLEEIFFRGFCYSVFRSKWGPRLAAIVTAAFFALIHGNAFAFLPIFVLGLVLAYVREKRESLLPSITLHILHNAIFISYFFLAKNIIAQIGAN